MTSKWKTALWVILYSVAIGALLTAFSFTPGFIKYVFSLLALYLIIRFFRKFETWLARICCIVLAVLMYLFGMILTAMIMYIRSGATVAP